MSDQLNKLDTESVSLENQKRDLQELSSKLDNKEQTLALDKAKTDLNTMRAELERALKEKDQAEAMKQKALDEKDRTLFAFVKSQTEIDDLKRRLESNRTDEAVSVQITQEKALGSAPPKLDSLTASQEEEKNALKVTIQELETKLVQRKDESEAQLKELKLDNQQLLDRLQRQSEEAKRNAIESQQTIELLQHREAEVRKDLVSKSAEELQALNKRLADITSKSKNQEVLIVQMKERLQESLASAKEVVGLRKKLKVQDEELDSVVQRLGQVEVELANERSRATTLEEELAIKLSSPANAAKGDPPGPSLVELQQELITQTRLQADEAGLNQLRTQARKEVSAITATMSQEQLQRQLSETMVQTAGLEKELKASQDRIAALLQENNRFKDFVAQSERMDEELKNQVRIMEKMKEAVAERENTEGEDRAKLLQAEKENIQLQANLASTEAKLAQLLASGSISKEDLSYERSRHQDELVQARAIVQAEHASKARKLEAEVTKLTAELKWSNNEITRLGAEVEQLELMAMRGSSSDSLLSAMHAKQKEAMNELQQANKKILNELQQEKDTTIASLQTQLNELVESRGEAKSDVVAKIEAPGVTGAVRPPDSQDSGSAQKAANEEQPNDQLEVLKSDNNKLTMELVRMEEQIQRSEARIKLLESQCKEAVKTYDINKELKQKAAQLENESQEWKDKYYAADADLTTSEVRSKELGQLLEQLQNRVAELQQSNALDELLKAKNAALAKIDHLLKVESMHEAQKKELQDQLVAARFDKTEMEKKIGSVTDAKMTNQTLKDEISNLKLQEGNLRLAITQLTRRTSDLEDDLAAKNRELENVRLNLESSENFVKDLQSRLADLEEQNRLISDNIGQGMEWGHEFESWKESKEREIERLEQVVVMQRAEKEKLVDENTRLLHEAGEQMHHLKQEMEEKESLQNVLQNYKESIKMAEVEQESLRVSNLGLQSQVRDLHNLNQRKSMERHEVSIEEAQTPDLSRIAPSSPEDILKSAGNVTAS